LNGSIVGILADPIEIRSQERTLYADHPGAADKLVVAAELPAEYRAATVDVAAGGGPERAGGDGVELGTSYPPAWHSRGRLRAVPT
jgi:hypothetical protein